MGFLGVYRAVYDYAPTAAGELAISDGDLLFILEKGEDDWWKAKKRAASEDEEEPEGLIPANYIEKAEPLARAKALYDYTRQTDEELSFSEDAALEVYDTSDPDWTLVGAQGEFGFAPANYIETSQAAPPTPGRPQIGQAAVNRTPDSAPSPVAGPAAALAGIIRQRTGEAPGGAATRRAVSPPPALSTSTRRPAYTPEASDEEAPAPLLPQRPRSEIITSAPPEQAKRSVQFQTPSSPESPPGVIASPPTRGQERIPSSPGGYHMYNIYEMVEVLGKSKKMPVTLGLNVSKGVIMISGEKDRSSKEWTADKLTHYSIEGKHVFMELVRPSKSIDFHAGAKDTAKEIVSALGELAGAARAEALNEVFTVSSGHTQKKGKMIYEFMAQGDDEVTVAEGDEVIILDDGKSDEWWMVRRLKNGKEGVVPSNYVDIIGTIQVPTAPPAGGQGLGLSYVEQNRLEEERLARQAAKTKKEVDFAPEVGSGLQLPKRNSSLVQSMDDSRRPQKEKKIGSARNEKKSLPNASKVRTWTDRSGSFKVDAEFLGLRDEKIHLHKLNGVKIAVPVPKMSEEDLEFVEKATGVSLDELKPLSDIRRKRSQRSASAGASVQKRPDYDWFDFFLSCGIDPQICERYSQAFNRDSIGEENLEDVQPHLLRTLGFKEGDILRVMKILDAKFGRQRATAEDGTGEGRLFSGPGGALKNNTAKGRPAPPTETKNELDPSLLTRRTSNGKTPTVSSRPILDVDSNGFDDNAWEPRASKASSPPLVIAAPSPPAAQKNITPGMAEMSLLDMPALTPAIAPQPAAVPQVQNGVPIQAQSTQLTGATPSLFEQLAKSSLQTPKQRPNQPQVPQQNGGMIAPPPNRSASAPQNPNQPGGFQPPPLQPQLTGYNPQPRMQTSAAPPGHSMSELNQQRLNQQQTGFMNAQMTGFGGPASFNQFQPNGSLLPQPTGYTGQFGQPQQLSLGGYQQSGFQNPSLQNPSLQQALINGQQNGSPFADSASAPFQPQATGYGGYGNMPMQPLQPQATGVNAFLPPALRPQATGLHASQWSQQSFSQPQLPPMPPMPPMPQMHQAPAPLIPQQTGPAPPVRFGTQTAKRLVSQPTGRANLSKATAQNPFGF